MIDDGNAIAELVRLVHVVRRQEHRQLALGLDSPEHLPDAHARYGIEAGGRLVEEEDARLVHEPSRDLHTPAHPARQVFHLRRPPLRELDGLEQLVDQLLALRPGTPYSFAKMIRFSSTLSSRSLVMACGMTPIERRTPSA